MPDGGCVDGYATNTKSRGRHTNAFRKRLFTLCMAWSSDHTEPRTFRGRKREAFPRAGCGKSASPVRGAGTGNRTKPNRTEVARRKPRRISTGRLQLLRQFSTLLAIEALINRKSKEFSAR